MKRNLFVDFDSTLVDSIKTYCDLYTELFQNHKDFKTPNPDLVNDWNLEGQCPLAKDMTEILFGHPKFFELLEFFPYAKEVIEELNTRFNITIVSLGTYDNIRYKAKFLKEKLPFIKSAILLARENVFMDKSIVAMPDNSIFIDDVQSNLDSILNPNIVKICYGRVYPWSKNWEGLRAGDWLSVRNLLLGKGNIINTKI